MLVFRQHRHALQRALRVFLRDRAPRVVLECFVLM